MIWTTTITTVSLLSLLVTAQPECDGTLWRVYPGNQKYFHKHADVAAMNNLKPQLPEIPKENTPPPVVVKAPEKKSRVKPEPAKPTLQSVFLRGLKQQIVNQGQQKAKAVVKTPPPARQKVIIPPSPVEPKKEIVIEYNMNSFRLTAHQKKEIAAHLDTCRRAAQIRIDAYADMVGSARYNKLLTDKRAKEVKNLLIALGINRNKISTRSLGQTNILPKGYNSRRTEIWLKGEADKK